jgi:hypothetical protein
MAAGASALVQTDIPRTPVAGPRDRFCVRSALLPMRKACLLHRRGANSTVSDRHLGSVGSKPT